MIDQALVQSKFTILKHIGYFLAFVVGTVGLSTDSFVILGVILVTDTLTGIIRAGTIKGWHTITSQRAMSGVLSKMLVMIIPLVLAWSGKGAGIEMISIAKGAMSILILAEAYSVISNIYAIVKREDVAEFDAVSWALKFIRDLFEKYLKQAKPTAEAEKTHE